jgi:hypothetical protein
MAPSFGKVPTTSVRRLISPLRRLIGLALCSSRPPLSPYQKPSRFSSQAGFDPSRFFGHRFSYEIGLFFVLTIHI